MTLAVNLSAEPIFAEAIRLVIWDLDETFWHGTLTEGGITYQQDHHDLVIELARRGIMSSICSKNVLSDVQPILEERGLWDYFIFPSIDWTPKGPRIRALLEEIGLRPQSALFLDDNPMNLAQARHMSPGLNTGLPELIPDLAEAPQLRGKPDAGLTRLHQYRVKQRKAKAAREQGGETVDFLRSSNVRVQIDHDVEANLDRVIELINRTNQLNFTKKRLPEDIESARAELREALSLNTTDAGLIRVRDDFGDYGYVGFYLAKRLHNVRKLEHFCFSCRTLNMYIEHWTYGFLGRPPLEITGEVLTDPTDRSVEVDWITPVTTDLAADEASRPPLRFDRIVARGGCDLASLMHYFGLHTDTVIEEFNLPKNGQMFRRDHTAFLMPALDGALDAERLRVAKSLGYDPDDFSTELFSAPTGNSLYLLSTWADADIPVYRHDKTGLRLPYWLIGAQNHDLIAREDLRAAVAETDLQRQRLETLCTEFTHEGLLTDEEMGERYARILNVLPTDAPVIIVLANERGPLHYQSPDRPAHPHHVRLNIVLRQLARGRPNVMLLDPADHIEGPQDLIDLNHFKRPVYHRMYRDAVERLARWQRPDQGETADG